MGGGEWANGYVLDTYHREVDWPLERWTPYQVGKLPRTLLAPHTHLALLSFAMLCNPGPHTLVLLNSDPALLRDGTPACSTPILWPYSLPAYSFPALTRVAGAARQRQL